MKSNFDFKNLLKRMPNLIMPKEFIYFGIGAVLVILIGLIVSNMYLQEMILFEGQQKSLQMFTEEELREYGAIYKELSLDFQSEIGRSTQGFARKENGSRTTYYVNRADEKIYYGIYNREHPTLNSSKIYPHSNGENVNKADLINDGEPYQSNYDDHYNDYPYFDDFDSTFIETDEFKNGIKIKYIKTEGRDDGESNFKDILTVVSMILDQKQSDNTLKTDGNDEIDLKEKVPELIKKLFKLSHTYSGAVSELYSCEQGCRALFYYCNEEDNKYKGTGIDLVPFEINPHDELEDYDSSEFEIFGAEGECEICGHNGKGCQLDSEKCYHGKEDEESGCKHIVSGEGECTNCKAHYICSYEGDGEHDCSDRETGCGGHYDCDGHEHFNCMGHFYVCCMGHRDLSITIKIMYVDEIINSLKGEYEFQEDVE